MCRRCGRAPEGGEEEEEAEDAIIEFRITKACFYPVLLNKAELDGSKPRIPASLPSLYLKCRKDYDH